MSLDVLGPVALGWAAVVGSVQIEAIRRTFRRAPPRSPEPRAASVLVIRPCAGSEPELERTLVSLARAWRSFTVRCRIAVADPADGAFLTAQKAAAALADQGIDARVVLTSASGPNRKVSQLARTVAAETTPFDAVLVADSDVDLTAMDLDRLLGPIACGRAGAVWAPPAEISRSRAIGDRASAAVLGASLHAFPLLAGLDPRGLVGKVFAVRRDALGEIGGFDALVDHLGEDLELGRRLRARGRAIEVAPIVARSVASGRSWGEATARFARWLGVIRAQRPLLLASYPLLFFATVPILLLAAIAAPLAPGYALAAALLGLSTRVAVALAAARAARISLARAAAGWILADALLAAAFVRALRTRTVVWRDQVITIDRTGLVREGA